MTEAVQGTGMTAVDAQFTQVKVLKPFDGFEVVYQGQPTSVPIAFPGTRDPQAGQIGFDPNLMEGIPVPLGSRILLWIPIAAGSPTGFTEYQYRVVWRYSTLGRFRNPGRADLPRRPWHFARQTPGAPDSTLGPTPVPRLLVPAAWRTVAFEQPEMALANGRVNLRPEEIAIPEFSLLNLVQPLLSDGEEGVIQQGVLDPATNINAAPVPLFLPIWFDVEGDEIMILANRINLEGPPPTWDFTGPPVPGVDFPFSNIFGTGDGRHENFRDVGIYLVTGTNP